MSHEMASSVQKLPLFWTVESKLLCLHDREADGLKLSVT